MSDLRQIKTRIKMTAAFFFFFQIPPTMPEQLWNKFICSKRRIFKNGKSLQVQTNMNTIDRAQDLSAEPKRPKLCFPSMPPSAIQINDGTPHIVEENIIYKTKSLYFIALRSLDHLFPLLTRDKGQHNHSDCSVAMVELKTVLRKFSIWF